MTTWTVYTTISNALLTPFLATAVASATTIGTGVLPLIIAGLTIKIMWMGYETMRGKNGINPFLDVFANSVRVGLVIALGITLYQANVIGFLDGLFGWLGNIFNTSGGITNSTDTTSLFNALDAAVNTAFVTFKAIYTIGMSPDNFSLNPINANLNGLVMILSGSFMLIGFFIYTLFAFYNLLFIKLALIFLYGIGPLFVACFAFPSLAKFFDSWLGAVLRYGITGVVITMVTGMANGLITIFSTNMSNADLNTLDYLMFGGEAIISMIILAKFTTKVPELAGAMTGHMGINIAAPGAASIAKTALDHFRGGNDHSRAESIKEARTETRHHELIGALSNTGNSEQSERNPITFGNLASNVDSHRTGSANAEGAGVISGSNARPLSASLAQMMANNKT